MILPTKGDPVDLLSGGRLQADNCDLFNRGWGEKFVEDGVVRYSAGGMGASCDFFLMDTVSAADTYLLNIEGKGIQGRGTKLYLFNRDTEQKLRDHKPDCQRHSLCCGVDCLRQIRQ